MPGPGCTGPDPNVRFHVNVWFHVPSGGVSRPSTRADDKQVATWTSSEVAKSDVVAQRRRHHPRFTGFPVLLVGH